jgi:hypothetical protein
VHSKRGILQCPQWDWNSRNLLLLLLSLDAGQQSFLYWELLTPWTYQPACHYF